jgi:prepilin-type N-terminal cleavage/methylation domain-containing protein
MPFRLQPSANDQQRGFTLVELLLVVAIIGILAGIAIPSFLRHRDGAYRATMATDLRNAVTAEYTFFTDHDTWTEDSSVLVDEGYRRSALVTPVHVKVAGADFFACVKHQAVSDWLVYDSATGLTTKSPSDCAS